MDVAEPKVKLKWGNRVKNAVLSPKIPLSPAVTLRIEIVQYPFPAFSPFITTISNIIEAQRPHCSRRFTAVISYRQLTT